MARNPSRRVTGKGKEKEPDQRSPEAMARLMAPWQPMGSQTG